MRHSELWRVAAVPALLAALSIGAWIANSSATDAASRRNGSAAGTRSEGRSMFNDPGASSRMSRMVHQPRPEPAAAVLRTTTRHQPAPSASTTARPVRVRETDEDREERSYYESRRELAFIELENALTGGVPDESAKAQVHARYKNHLAQFGLPNDFGVACRSGICKVSLTVSSEEMAASAELLPPKVGDQHLVRVSGDPALGVINGVEIFILSQSRLTRLMGGSIEGVLGPGAEVTTDNSSE
jgi:hypothetical protein